MVAPRSRLGPYEIVSLLGVGGMGEVYLARDTRLDRDVAIKILAGPLATDPSRRERFEREARIISSLNHPNICALYDVGREGDQAFLVLEHLEGEPLDRRLARSKGGQLPLTQALAIATQIADALDKAHRVGIVHRDLKPQNIFLTRNGAKLLDFGLAKVAGAVTSAAVVSGVQTVSGVGEAGNLTVDGTMVGTLPYMAPEQITGAEVDVRTDIFAFGVVFYEMLTGRRPYPDQNPAELNTAVFDCEPTPITLSVPAMPLGLDRLISTCMARDPDDRFQSAHDLLLQLRWAATPTSDIVLAQRSAKATRRWQYAALAAITVLAATVIMAGRILMNRPVRSTPESVTRFSYAMPLDQNFTRAGRRPLAISHDGTRLVYVANRQLYLKPTAELTATPIRGSNDDPSDAIFSPDGQWLLYWSAVSAELRKIAVGGGASTLVAKTLNPSGMSWSGDRLFVSQGKRGIVEFAVAGGAPRQAITARPDEALFGPELLPDGDTLIFSAKPDAATRWDDAEIVAESMRSGVRKILVHGGTDAHYLAPGYLVYAHDAAIVGVPFDARRLEVGGPPVPLVNGVGQAASNTTGAAFYSVSTNGTLAYVPGDAGQQRTLVLLDRQGRETRLNAPAKAYTRARFSPDGRHVEMDVREVDTDIWLWDVAREVATRLTFGRSDEANAIWTPDSRRLVYYSNQDGRFGLYRLSIDGTGEPELLITSPNVLAPLAFSPDGKVLAYFELRLGTAAYQINTFEPDGDRTPRSMLGAAFTDPYIAISPDGRWLAFTSNESGRNEVYVRRFPRQENDAPQQLATGGGSYLVWPRSGHELFMLDPERRIVSVPVTTGRTFSAGKPEPLFVANYLSLPIGRAFDVSDDGRQFLMIKEPQTNRQFIFVEHWFDDLARRIH
ncbi:MAG TPA: protein kinase [Vicinamibacterales bacterium]